MVSINIPSLFIEIKFIDNMILFSYIMQLPVHTQVLASKI